MFAKPYKLKSNTTLKNSEKKFLSQRILDEFPTATEEKAKLLVPVKSSCICMKLVLHSGDIVSVYSMDSMPMIIEAERRLIPTVCALWKVPELVPVLIIQGLVLSKIQGGAPLYLPGVVTPAGGQGFPLFQRDALIAICTHDNSAACTVGRALMSSADMLLRTAGVCLETYQVFGDQLCKDNKFSKIERPKMGVPSYSQGDLTDSMIADVSQLSIQPTIKEEWPSLGRPAAPTRNAPPTSTEEPPVPTVAPPVPNEPRLITDPPACGESSDVQADDITEKSEADEIPRDADGLLRWCLLSFLKLRAKTTEYPYKTNLLYKDMMQLCPPDRSVDVKKSSYKKLGKFLEAVQQEGLLEVRELDKGVAALAAANAAHPAVRAHRVPASVRASACACACAASDDGSPEYVPPTVREVYCVTAALMPVLAPHRKGTALTSGEVRALLMEYVRSKGLSSATEKGAVTMDANLSKITGTPEGEALRWEALMAGALGRMTAAAELQFADGSAQRVRGGLEPVRMQLASRAGNKKVTLVSNLEAFGFNLTELSHVCQTGVAASCGITRSPGSKYDQLMIQGDQTHFVAKLLIEKYGLPKKYVEGADKALNKKKR